MVKSQSPSKAQAKSKTQKTPVKKKDAAKPKPRTPGRSSSPSKSPLKKKASPTKPTKAVSKVVASKKPAGKKVEKSPSKLVKKAPPKKKPDAKAKVLAKKARVVVKSKVSTSRKRVILMKKSTNKSKPAPRKKASGSKVTPKSPKESAKKKQSLVNTKAKSTKKVVSSAERRASRSPASKSGSLVKRRLSSPSATPAKQKKSMPATPKATPTRKSPAVKASRPVVVSKAKSPKVEKKPVARVQVSGKGKLPTIRLGLRKPQARSAAKKIQKAKVLQASKTSQAIASKRSKQAVKKAKMSKQKAVAKKQRSPVKVDKVNNNKNDDDDDDDDDDLKDHKTTKVVAVSDNASPVTTFTKVQVANQRESSPQIRIDLTGARPSPAVKVQKASKAPQQTPTKQPQAKPAAKLAAKPAVSAKSDIMKSTEQKLMETLSVSQKQAQELVRSILSKSGKSQVVQYMVNKDAKGVSRLKKMEETQVPRSPGKATQRIGEAAEKADNSRVSMDLSSTRFTPVTEQVVATPKGGVSLDLTAAKLSSRPNKTASSPKGKIAVVGAQVKDGAGDQTGTPPKLQKPEMVLVKTNASPTTDEDKIKQLIKMRKMRKSPAGSKPEDGKETEEKKANIIVRCSACKNFFEPGQDFVSHKAECLKLHARCAGCQKYFQRGQQYDTHKAQCTASPQSAEDLQKLQEQQKAVWDNIVSGKDNEDTRSTQPSYKCIICKEPFSTYKESREHEEKCGLLPAGDRSGVMCSDCKQTFKGRILLSRHKTQYPGCPAKPPKALPSDEPTPPTAAPSASTSQETASLSAMGKPINVQVTFHNGVPQVAVNVGGAGEGEKKQEESKEKEAGNKEGATPDLKDESEAKGKKRPIQEVSPSSEASKKAKVAEKPSPSTDDKTNTKVKDIVKEDSSSAPRDKEADATSKDKGEKAQPAEEPTAEQGVTKQETEEDIPEISRTKGLTLSDGTPLSKCPLCDKLFKHTQYLKKHFKSFHALDFEDFVGNKEKQQEALRNARSETLRARIQEKKGCTCLDCGEWMPTRLALNIHKKKCTRKNVVKVLFPCTLCANVQFPNRVELYEHMRDEHSADAELANSLSITCDVCYARFASRGDMIKHHQQVHKSVASSVGAVAPRMLKRCLDCGMLVDAAMLNQHKETCSLHLVSKPFVCFDCHEQFSNRQELTTHKRNEHLFSGTPYCCWRCMRNFNFYPDLIQHVMEVHRKEEHLTAKGETAPVAPKGKSPKKKVTQQVFKIQGDANLVKLNMFPNKKGGSKPMVLDLSKLKGLMKNDEPGKRNVVTLPASALAGCMEEEDAAGSSKPVLIEPLKKKPRVEEETEEPEVTPGTSVQEPPEESGIGRMTAALNLQPKATEDKAKAPAKAPAARTRSKTGPSPPLPQKPSRAGPSRGAKVQPAPEQKSPPTPPAQQQKKKHQPAILRRSSSGAGGSGGAGDTGLLQAVGKDQVRCTQCGQVLATMKAVASHTCLTGANTEWNLQKIHTEGDSSDVEWFVAS